MATKVPPIGRPNFRAIATMHARDLFEAREYYIVRIVSAFRANDADTLNAALEWLNALCSEMMLRGGTPSAHADPMVIL